MSGGAVPGLGVPVEVAGSALGAGAAAGLAGAGLGLADVEPDCLITRCTVMPGRVQSFKTEYKGHRWARLAYRPSHDECSDFLHLS